MEDEPIDGLFGRPAAKPHALENLHTLFWCILGSLMRLDLRPKTAEDGQLSFKHLGFPMGMVPPGDQT